MQITQCLHAAVLVSDLAEAEEFYSTVLGLPKVERSLRFPGAWYQVGEFQIHLIVDSKAARALNNADKWGRNPHIAFQVLNLDEAEERLRSQGHPIQRSASGRAALFVQDPDGNVIEISQAGSIKN